MREGVLGGEQVQVGGFAGSVHPAAEFEGFGGGGQDGGTVAFNSVAGVGVAFISRGQTVLMAQFELSQCLLGKRRPHFGLRRCHLGSF